MSSTDDDPLAPPPGYGQAAGRSGAQEQPAQSDDDFRLCCTGCGLASIFVLTLGCTKGEHVGDFGYCGTHSRGPFWCGRCQRAGPDFTRPWNAMKILKQRWIDGEPVEPARMKEILARVFDGKAP